ncbi:MAG: glycoside hydrolase [Planctomycetes bacterium]|nr:glycoside hydrolase [Planctomycetota bacterium]
MTTLFIRCAVAVALVLSAGGVRADGGRDTSWPAVTAECRPWTRWWWLGSAVDKRNLTAELEAIAAAGFGGVEITPIYGAKGAEERFLPFLSPEYVAALEFTCAEAARLGLGVDMATGTGWPFGGPHVGPDDAELRIAGKEGRFDPQPTRFKVKRSAPGGEGFVVNPFSPAAARRYLEPFTEALSPLPRGAIHGQFHDSFEYQANWSPEVPKAFREMHGYDLDSQRRALEGDGDAETVARVKSDYRATLAKLHLDYLKVWVDWCHSLGCEAREQAHGAPANLIDLYALADVPETEVFGASRFAIPGYRRDERQIGKNLPQPLVTRLASSAAHLARRPRASSETFTWMREHFCEAPSQMKPEIDQLFLAGINHVFYHGTAYSPADAAWPGWLFYASTQANPRNPLWREFGAVNAYVARAQSLLQSGEPDNDVLVYWPIHDLYHSSRGWQRAFSMHGRDWLTESPTGLLAQSLLDAGLSFDLCSDALLTEASRYRAVVVPPCRLVPHDTLRTLLDHAEAGGIVIFVGGVPEDVPGLGRLQERRAALAAELARLHWPEQDRGPRRAEIGMGRVVVVADAAGVAMHAGARIEPVATRGLGCLRRKTADGHLYFLANLGAEPFDGWVPLGTSLKSAVLMDARNGHSGVAATRGTDRPEVRLQVDPGESIFIRTFGARQADGEPWRYAEPDGEAVPLVGRWSVTPLAGGPELPRAVGIDHLGTWTDQGGEWERFAGTARYEVAFDLPAAPAGDWLLDLGDVREVARVSVNGREIDTLWSVPFRTRLGGAARPGRNTLSIEVTNVAANRIRDLETRGVAWKNFHEINFVDVHYKPFDAADWPLQPSGLLGPVRLVPLTIDE